MSAHKIGGVLFIGILGVGRFFARTGDDVVRHTAVVRNTTKVSTHGDDIFKYGNDLSLPPPKPLQVDPKIDSVPIEIAAPKPKGLSAVDAVDLSIDAADIAIDDPTQEED